VKDNCRERPWRPSDDELSDAWEASWGSSNPLWLGWWACIEEKVVAARTPTAETARAAAGILN